MSVRTNKQSAFRVAAEQVYQNMRVLFLDVDRYQSSSNRGDTIWPQGNAFDTVLDYMQLSGKRDNEFLEAVCTYFEKQDGGRYDDWIWPAASSAKAFYPAYQAVFEGDVNNTGLIRRFQNIALRNWKNVIDGIHKPGNTTTYDGTQNVWSSIEKNPQWQEVEPRFKGGSWQSDINIDNDPLSETTDGEAGFQLSVMNGLVLKFAGLIGNIDQTRFLEHSAIIQQAKQVWGEQYHFVKQWIGAHPRGPISRENLLFKYDHSDQTPSNHADGGLIRERVSTYAYQNGTYPRVLFYNPDRVWTGDQGLMIAGFGQGITEPEVRLGIMTGIINGVKTNLYTESNGKYIIKSRSEDGSWYTLGCPACYATGGGIFLRGFLSALRSDNQGLVNNLKDEQTGWQDMIKNLANTAINDDLYGSVDTSIIGLFPPMTRLSALNLAIYCEKDLSLNLSEL